MKTKFIIYSLGVLITIAPIAHSQDAPPLIKQINNGVK